MPLYSLAGQLGAWVPALGVGHLVVLLEQGPCPLPASHAPGLGLGGGAGACGVAPGRGSVCLLTCCQ